MSSTLDHQKPQANNSSSSIDEEEAIGAGHQLNRNITPGSVSPNLSERRN